MRRGLLLAPLAFACMMHATPSTAGPATQGNGTARPRPVAVGMSLADLPRAVLPAQLEAAKRPASLDDLATADDIAIEPSSPQDQVTLAAIRAGTSAPRQTMHVKMKVSAAPAAPATPAAPVTTVPQDTGAIYFATGATNVAAAALTWAQCGDVPAHAPQMRSAVRWERITFQAGEPVLEVSDGWIDSKKCRVATARRTTIKPRLVQLDYGVSALVFRDDDSLTMIIPEVTEVMADALVGAATFVRGVGATRVVLPMKKGGAATFLASLDVGGLRKWQGVLRKTDPLPTNVARMRFTGDVTQTVRDDAPIALLRIAPML